MSRGFNYAWLALSVAIIIVLSFNGGVAASDRHFTSMITDMVSVAVWAFLIAIIIRSIVVEERHELVVERLKMRGKITEAVTEALDELKKTIGESTEDTVHDLIHELVEEVTGGGRAPNKTEVARIEQLFHERTDHYLKIDLQQGGMNIEVSSKPIDPAADTGTHMDTVKRVSKRKPKKAEKEQ